MMDWDERIETRNHQSLYYWLRSLDDIGLSRILAWVSTFHDGMPCRKFAPYDRGGFNFCIPVEFDNGDRWMVRLPRSGKCHHADDKVLREVATMQYVRENTCIPVPEVHAWGLSEQNVLGFGPFIMMDFVDGIPLSDVWRPPNEPRNFVGMIRSDVPREDLSQVYRQFATYYLDLQCCRFDVIGSLGNKRGDLIAPFTLKMHETEVHSNTNVPGEYSSFSRSSSCR